VLPNTTGTLLSHSEARRVTHSPTFGLPLAQVGVALVSPKKAHRVFILDIFGTIYDVDHLAFSTNSVAGTNVLDYLLKLARYRIPITSDFNSNLVVRHRTSSRLWPHPCPQLLAVRSIRYAVLFALKEACALIVSDVWTTDSDLRRTRTKRLHGTTIGSFSSPRMSSRNYWKTATVELRSNLDRSCDQS
jgi:hypothetical protein